VNSDIVNGKIRSSAPPAQLYDLENDPSQTQNLYQQYPEVVEKLEELLKNLSREKLRGQTMKLNG
jgi:arylsulfatase A